MKHIVLILALILATPSLAQRTAPKSDNSESSKITASLAKRGSVITKDYFAGGSVDGNYGTSVSIEGVVITLGTGGTEKLKGIRLTIKKGDDEGSAFLDYEDLQSFSAALSYLASKATEMAVGTREYTEVIYRGKDDFEAGFYQQGSKQAGYMTVKSIPQMNCFFDSPQDLLKLKKAVDDAGVNVQSK